ncbi:hypothetical protein BL163_00003135, partial [Klebsiella pneumoniae]
MLKKTALSCAASAFTAVPGRDCHQQPSSHNPHNPSTTTPGGGGGGGVGAGRAGGGGRGQRRRGGRRGLVP